MRTRKYMKEGKCVCCRLYRFTGNVCATDIDDCESQPCQNGGTCLDGVNSFSCLCPTGFTGSVCDKDVDECESALCLNKGLRQTILLRTSTVLHMVGYTASIIYCLGWCNEVPVNTLLCTAAPLQSNSSLHSSTLSSLCLCNTSDLSYVASSPAPEALC